MLKHGENIVINNIFSMLEHKDFKIFVVLNVFDFTHNRFYISLAEVIPGQFTTVNINFRLVPNNSVAHINTLDVHDLPDHDVSLEYFVDFPYFFLWNGSTNQSCGISVNHEGSHRSQQTPNNDRPHSVRNVRT